RDVLLGPRNEAVTFLARWVFDAGSRINLGVTRHNGPLEQPAHGVEEVPRLVGRVSPPLAARCDRIRCDLGERLLSGGRKHLSEDVLSLLAGSYREGGPARGFPIAIDKPAQCPGCR